MIVRIATEGQYRLPDEELDRLNALDDAVAAAVESRERKQFDERFSALLAHVRSGEPVDDDILDESDLIVPPPDLSLEEAAAEFSGDGLIPD